MALVMKDRRPYLLSMLCLCCMWLGSTGISIAAGPDVLIEDLTQSGDYKIRMSAARALGSYGGPGAARALINALEDDHRLVRGAAAEALGRLQVAEAIGPLCALRATDDAFVARSVEGALDRLGSMGACALPGSAPGFALGLHIHGASPALSKHVRTVMAANVTGMPRVVVTDDLDGARQGDMAELKIRLGATVERHAGSTEIGCQMTHTIFQVRRQSGSLKRILKASNRYQAQVSIGGNPDARSTESEQRACFDALAPLVVTDLQTWMASAR